MLRLMYGIETVSVFHEKIIQISKNANLLNFCRILLLSIDYVPRFDIMQLENLFHAHTKLHTMYDVTEITYD